MPLPSNPGILAVTAHARFPGASRRRALLAACLVLLLGAAARAEEPPATLTDSSRSGGNADSRVSAPAQRDSALATPVPVPTHANLNPVPAPAQAPIPDSVSTPPPATPSEAAPAMASPESEAPTIEAPAVEAAEGPQGPDDLVIEVDPAQSRNKDKSLPLAMLFSATLPGAGEYYLHEKGNAKAFLLTEAGFWASLYVAFLARESYLASARNYASEFAGIEASGKSVRFLETMAEFRSYQEKQHRQDSYELAQVLSGKRERDYDIPASPENYWDFGSSVNPGNTRNWRTFQSSLRYYRASKVAISFAVGALALNRLVSLANTLRVYKRTSAKGIGLKVVPEIGPDYTGARISLGF